MTIKGTIKRIGATQTVSDGKFSKRELVLTTADQYPQIVSVELQQKACSLADSLSVGQDIEAHINIRGREWTSPQGEVKVFNTIACWKVDANPFTQTEDPQVEYSKPSTSITDSDLPF
jgi:translation initiation factor IF-3